MSNEFPENELGWEHEQVDREPFRERGFRGSNGRRDRSRTPEPGDSGNELRSAGMGNNGQRPENINGASESDFNPLQPALFDSTPGQAQISLSRHHQGPLPDPVTLLNYGSVDASFPERIVRMAENQIEAQVSVATKTANAAAFSVRLGAVTASLIAVASIIAFVVLVLQDTSSGLAAASLIPAILAGIAQMFSAVRRAGR